MVNNDRHPPSPRLPVVTLPQACPPTLGAFYCGMQVATAGLLGSLSPRTTGTQRNAPRRQQGFKFLRDAGRPGEESGSWAMFGGDAPDIVAGGEVRRRAERCDHGLLRRNRDGVATMFEMFGKLAVGLSSSPVMAWNRSRTRSAARRCAPPRR
jgi:hypothetical protein